MIILKGGKPLASLKQSWKDFWRYRYLLQNLITRDFKLKYRRSVLGVAWSVLNPLLMCLVMYAIFTSIFAGMRGQNIDNFAVFLLVGQLLFNFFRESTTMAMESVLKNAPLLRKVYIPKYIFPLEKVCFGLVNCLFSFVALVLVMLITRTPLHLSFILCVYPLATLFFFCLGIGLFLSATYVFFRDVMHMWEVFCTALTYASAIFYDPEQDGNCVSPHPPEPAVLVHYGVPQLRAVGAGADRADGSCVRRLCRVQHGGRHFLLQAQPGSFCAVYVRRAEHVNY